MLHSEQRTLERLKQGSLEKLFSEMKLDAHWMHSVLKELIKVQNPKKKKAI